jgi:hypothetical protein
MLAVENIFVRNLSENEHNLRRGSDREHILFSQVSVTGCSEGRRKSPVRGNQAKSVGLFARHILCQFSQVSIKIWNWVGQRLSFEASKKLILPRKSFSGVFHSYGNVERFVLLRLPVYTGWSNPCSLIELYGVTLLPKLKVIEDQSSNGGEGE